MATIEELIRQTLITDAEMAEKLVQYKNTPAVFEKQAPGDGNKDWHGTQYPRLTYLAVFQDDPERKVSGIVTIDIVTKLDDETGPEVVEEILKRLLDGTFYETNMGTLATRWQRSDLWDEVDEQVTGMTVILDILAFPKQTLPDDPGNPKPDPIAGLISWTRTLLNEEGAFFVNGNPQTQPVWKPTAVKPAIYWRFAREELYQLTNAVAWFNASCACHVMAPSPTDRIPYIRQITDALAAAGTITLPDDSPMLFFGNINADSNGDMLSVGQITVSGRYGVLRPTPIADYKLNNIEFKEG